MYCHSASFELRRQHNSFDSKVLRATSRSARIAGPLHPTGRRFVLGPALSVDRSIVIELRAEELRFVNLRAPASATLAEMKQCQKLVDAIPC